MALSSVILLVYAEGLFPFFEIYKEHAQFRAIVSIQLLMTLYFVGCAKPLYKLNMKSEQALWLIIYLFIFDLILVKFTYTTISTFTWITIPILWAISFRNYIINKGLNIVKVVKGVFFWYSFYCIFAILINVVRYNLYLDPNTRLSTPGGGAVIFGYTLAVLLSLLPLYKKYIRAPAYLTLNTIFLLTIFGTGSRGALWISFLIIIASSIFQKGTSLRFKVFAACSTMLTLLILTLFNFWEFLLQRNPRLFETSDYSRETSSLGVWLTYFGYDTYHKFFGSGLGLTFPYQEWLIDVTRGVQDEESKLFETDGGSMLVQPHNSYYYFLLESGVVGLGLLLYPFVRGIKDAFKSSDKLYLIYIFTFMFVNCFDSVLIVQPGAAGILWLMFFTTNYIKKPSFKGVKHS